MEYLPNGFTLELSPNSFPLSTDSMVLAHFTKLPKQARVLDLGAGCGTLGLLLCAKDPACHVTGLELSETAHMSAVENIRRNGLQDRMESICADLRRSGEIFPAGSFSVCISNPPYFSGGPASKQLTAARREDTCSLEELLHTGAKLLKYGGDFYLVHRPERLAEIIALGAANSLEAKRLLLVRHRPESEISIIALQLRKGGKPGLKIEEAVLFDSLDAPTGYYRNVYHLD